MNNYCNGSLCVKFCMIFFGKRCSFAKEKSRLTIVKELIFGYNQYHNSFICNNAPNLDVVTRGGDRELSNPTFARIRECNPGAPKTRGTRKYLPPKTRGFSLFKNRVFGGQNFINFDTFIKVLAL